MSAALLFIAGSWLGLAQAEPEPPDAAAPGAPEAVPGPAEAAPPSPAGAAPAPARTADAAPRSRSSSVAFTAGAAHRLDPPGSQVPPAWGFAFGLLARAPFATTGALALSVEPGFAFDRYLRMVGVPGAAHTLERPRTFSIFDFGVALNLAAALGPAVPYVAAGPLLSVGNFHSDEPAFRPGSARRTRLAIGAAAGVDVAAGLHLSVGARADLARLLGDPVFVSDDGARHRLFGHRLRLSAVVSYRY